MACVDFEAVFTGVARAAHDDGFAIILHGLECVENEVGSVDFEHALQHGFAVGTLYGELTVDVALVVNLHVEVFSVFHNPSHVLIDIGGVDNEEKVVFAHLVHQQVVDGATVGVEHHAVEDFTHWGIGDVVGEYIVYEFFCFRACDFHFTHV